MKNFFFNILIPRKPGRQVMSLEKGIVEKRKISYFVLARYLIQH